MSTIQSYSVAASEDARRRANARRRAKEELRRRQEELRRRQKEIQGLHSKAKTLGANLQQTVRQINQNIERTQELQWHTANELQELSKSIEIAQQTIKNVELTHSEAREHIRQLGAELQKGEAIRLELEAKTAQQRQLERELNFVTQDAQLLLPSMMTLMAMQSNGYVLRETISEEGLIAYFDSVDGQHQVAVKPRQRSALSEEWEMLVETFQLSDETCLDVLEDFVLGVEETELGELSLTSRRYPKRDGQALPLPRKQQSYEQPIRQRGRVTSGSQRIT